MKIGIHHSDNSFSESWIKYCEKENIPFKIVDCYRNDIIKQLEDCDGLMWHFHQANSKDVLFAKQLLYSVQMAGKKVFPDFNTAWHFDDKVGQKYLLEAAGAPFVPSYVFYDENQALEWVETTQFPKVFKLRRGAGSAHVQLVENEREAQKLINKAFGRGFRQYNAWANLKERWRKFKRKQVGLKSVLKGIVRLGYTTDFDRVVGREKGYIYFQDFIADNDHDIRVIVIDGKAFAIKRLVRKNDFRASGSGAILYGKDNFDLNTIKLSFQISRELKSQCLAIDYVFDEGHPLVVEVSYGFVEEGYNSCEGYWNEELKWHEGNFNPQGWMVQKLIKCIRQNSY
ncbi:MAG: hypothetical protein U5K69_18840 [Balneolaceae bacterium]|nr:hypothetical protein [Balneolaceae bacterium]